MNNSYSDLCAGELQCELNRHVLTLRLNRPSKANALSSSMLHGIQGVLSRVVKDKAVNAVLLTANGDRVFSGGADLKEMQQAEQDESFATTYYGLWNDVIASIENCPVPVVVLVNGACVAGGLSIALACDIRIATPNAFLSYPRIADGHLPGKYNLKRLMSVVGESRTRLIMLMGYRVHAHEAQHWGLIDTVLETSNLEEQIENLLRPLQNSDRDLLEIAGKLISPTADDSAWAWAENAFHKQGKR